MEVKMKTLSLLILFVVFSFPVAEAQDGPDVWTSSSGNIGRIYSMVINPQNDNIIYAGSLDSGVYKTTNAGLNWFSVNNGLSYRGVLTLAISPSNPQILFAGTDENGGYSSGVYKTTNGGANWGLMINGITDPLSIQAIAIHPTNPDIAFITVFDGLTNSNVGLFKTTNGGANWFGSNNGIGTIKNLLSILFNHLNPNVMYVGTSFNLNPTVAPTKIYKSFDEGANWNDISNGLPTGTTTGNPVRALCMSSVDTSLVLAALFLNDTTGGAYLTTNGGLNWYKKYGLPNTSGTLLRSCVMKPVNVNEFYVGLDRSTGTNVGIWRTTDAGNTWTDFSGGALLNTYSIRGIVCKTSGNLTLFSGAASTVTAGRGVFDYTFTTVSVQNQGGETPKDFELYPNYPNPFNPTTKIRYELPLDGFVSLNVFDLTGRLVSILVNKKQSAGCYSLDFDASGLPSGVYLYRIEYEAYNKNFVKTRKMLLLK